MVVFAIGFGLSPSACAQSNRSAIRRRADGRETGCCGAANAQFRVLPFRKTWLAPKSDESEPVSISDLLLCWLTETWFEVSEMPSPQTASTAEAFSAGEWVLPCRMTECGGYCAKTRQRKRHAPTHS